LPPLRSPPLLRSLRLLLLLLLLLVLLLPQSRGAGSPLPGSAARK
jgi:hypothetical protein